jgi:formylglycine-generating enzyme required for sulfatase activity
MNFFTTKLRRRAIRLSLVLALGILCVGAWMKLTARRPPKPALAILDVARDTSERVGGMVRIPSGELPLGSHLVVGAAERPLPTLPMEEFWMDATEVTNRQFAEFVAATGYATTAEQEGASDVFVVEEHRWQKTPGADWRHPTGTNSSIAGREAYPVVQVSWTDAAAYARWAGKRLPTEYQWEYAARGGLYDADYPWGRSEMPGGAFRANGWQGWFPDTDRGTDGFRDLAPVASFPANRYGLCDMAGNVWEWCADEYLPSPNHASALPGMDFKDGNRPRLQADSVEPLAAPPLAKRSAEHDDSAGQTSHAERRIRRGGSWLCCENYSLGLKLSTRSSMPTRGRSNHVGFRCVSDEPTILPLATAHRANQTPPLVK